MTRRRSPVDSFTRLDPDAILDAVETAGWRCDGHVSALNSYENRVYQVGIEDRTPIIAKFYRPGRWSDAAIAEEHRFTRELAAGELPVITPFEHHDGTTLLHAGPYRLALYPRVGGRAPELDNAGHLQALGRSLARLHNIGAVAGFTERPRIDVGSYAEDARAFLLAGEFIPADIRSAYETLSAQLIERLYACFAAIDVQTLRLHGDCHLGNVLWQAQGPFLVDFDDARTGPAIQDLWMLLSGDRHDMTLALHDVLAGYCEFRPFDPRELQLVEPLRTLRLMHYAAWLARRWEDPAFPQAFPWFNSQKYWQDHVLALREQFAALDELPLQWQPV